MAGATGPTPGGNIFDRFPPEMGSARASVEAEFATLDRLVVRDESGHLLIDENAFRPALQGLAVSNQQIDDLISASPASFTTVRGLPAVPISELGSAASQIQPATDQQLDEAGFPAGSSVQALRTAFTNSSGVSAAILNMTAAELRQRIEEALTSGELQAGITADVTFSSFLNCLLGEMTWIVVWIVIHALAAWGVGMGAIVLVGISTAFLWWLIVISFGLGMAFLVFRCLF